MTLRSRLFLVSVPLLWLLACGSSGGVGGPDSSIAVQPDGRADGRVDAAVHDSGGGEQDAGTRDVGVADATSPDVHADDGSASGGCSTACPAGYTCGAANGLAVCRAASGIPLFSHVFLIMEENTSLSTLVASMNANAAPNFESLRAKYATATGYHGVTHPSLPNYIALTSGSPQGIGCDCHAQSGQGSCNALDCNLVLGSCTCTQSVTNLADQLETAGKTWTAFAEGMGMPCNVVDDDTTNYAVRHVPFVYYDDIQSNATRCGSHVLDYSSFKAATAPQFTYIAPNLVDDMHNPVPATQGNITNGDDWIGPVAAEIMASSAYTDGGLFVIAWDEDDDSGGITGTDDPVPLFVFSPYAKTGGYMSAATLDHYSLLATIEDGLNLPRLGNAGVPRANTEDTLADFFPNQ